MTNPLIIDDDDRPIGRVMSRREVLSLLGVGAAGVVAVACAPSAVQSLLPTSSASPTAGATAAPTSSGVAIPSCVVRPEMTEGPYFVDERLQRADIRPDTSSGNVSAGTALALAFAVSKVSTNSCVPFAGALVDVWHCDADGRYSDEANNNTDGQNFLRGYQVTDASGNAAFTTIYPGWYQGRTVHIHFKIRTDPDASSGFEFTSQLFFDEAVTAEAYSVEPYASRGAQDTTNARDGIYQNGGSQLLLTPTRSADGYATTFDIGVVA
jgi:protocatechuate 3,4-dioxygenase beta subunit